MRWCRRLWGEEGKPYVTWRLTRDAESEASPQDTLPRTPQFISSQVRRVHISLQSAALNGHGVGQTRTPVATLPPASPGSARVSLKSQDFASHTQSKCCASPLCFSESFQLPHGAGSVPILQMGQLRLSEVKYWLRVSQLAAGRARTV